MAKWFALSAAALLGLMAFALTASTWLWLMGFAAYPGDSVMAGRVFLGAALAGGAALLVGTAL